MADDIREDTIQDLLDENDSDDLQRMQHEIRELTNETEDERVEDLLRYRLELVEDAIEQVDDAE